MSSAVDALAVELEAGARLGLLDGDQEYLATFCVFEFWTRSQLSPLRSARNNFVHGFENNVDSPLSTIVPPEERHAWLKQLQKTRGFGDQFDCLMEVTDFRSHNAEPSMTQEQHRNRLLLLFSYLVYYLNVHYYGIQKSLHWSETVIDSKLNTEWRSVIQQFPYLQQFKKCNQLLNDLKARAKKDSNTREFIANSFSACDDNRIRDSFIRRFDPDFWKEYVEGEGRLPLVVASATLSLQEAIEQATRFTRSDRITGLRNVGHVLHAISVNSKIHEDDDLFHRIDFMNQVLTAWSQLLDICGDLLSLHQTIRDESIRFTSPDFPLSDPAESPVRVPISATTILQELRGFYPRPR